MKKILLFLVICLAACEGTPKEKMEEVNSLSYFKDNRTGICFTVSLIHSQLVIDTIYTAVPCTPEVERLIQK